MIVHDFTGTENHPIYQTLTVDNGNRQYDFLRSIVAVALEMKRPYFSPTILRALNFHAIACLHPYAGEYRPCKVTVGEDYFPPEAFAVPSLMEDFVNQVNHEWERADPLVLATFVLWKLNLIHPFINGNGRTARAASYYVLCCKLGGWLKGDVILPEALRRNRDEYVAAIKAVDASAAAGQFTLAPLHAMLQRLYMQQLGIEPEPEPPIDPLAEALPAEAPEVGEHAPTANPVAAEPSSELPE